MRTLALVVVGCVFLLKGCFQFEEKSTCSLITHATKVVVSNKSSLQAPETAYAITDSGRLANLVAFFNARRDCSRSTVAPLPSGNNGAAFYNGTEWLATVSWGSDFFILVGKECKGTRHASIDESKQFEGFVAFDPKKDALLPQPQTE